MLEQATSPIALRYWNYCLNRADERTNHSGNAPWKVSSLVQQPAPATPKLERRGRPQTPCFNISNKPEAVDKRTRSESVPRTFRTFKVTARVESPTPTVMMKTDGVKQSKSSSPVTERPPTPKRRSLVSNNNLLPTNEPATVNKLRNDEENSTKSAEVNCDNGKTLTQSKAEMKQQKFPSHLSSEIKQNVRFYIGCHI